MKKWSTKNRKEIMRAHVFKYETIESSSPDGDKSGVFDIVSCLDWVNVVAISEEGQLILVKQYRHGTDEITLETPAGAIEKGEVPLAAAKRELEEETGYISNDWKDLGKVKVNPAFMTNTCHVYLADNCKDSGQQSFDPLEEIELERIDKSKISELIEGNRIDHSLSLLSLLKYLRLLI